MLENQKRIPAVCTQKLFIINIRPKFLTIPFDPNSDHMNIMNMWSADKAMKVWTMNVKFQFWFLLC